MSRTKKKSNKVSLSDKGSSDEGNDEFYGISGHGGLDKMVSKTVFQLKKVIQKKKEAYHKGSQSVPIHHNNNNISGGQIDTSQKTETAHEPVKTNDNNGKMVDNSRDADVSAVDQQPASHLSPKSMGIDNSVHIKPLKLDGDHSSKHRKHKSKHKHSKHHHHHRHHSSHHHKSKHKHYPHSVHAMPSGNGFIPSERYFSDVGDNRVKVSSAPTNHDNHQLPYIDYDGNDAPLSEISYDVKDKLKIRLPNGNANANGHTNNNGNNNDGSGSDNYEENGKVIVVSNKKNKPRRMSNSIFKGFVNNIMHDVVDTLYDEEEYNADPDFHKAVHQYNLEEEMARTHAKAKGTKHHPHPHPHPHPYPHGHPKHHGKHHPRMHPAQLQHPYYNPQYGMLYPYYHSSNHSDRDLGGYTTGGTQSVVGKNKSKVGPNGVNVTPQMHGKMPPYGYPPYYNPYGYPPYMMDMNGNPIPHPHAHGLSPLVSQNNTAKNSTKTETQTNKNETNKAEETKAPNDLAVVKSGTPHAAEDGDKGAAFGPTNSEIINALDHQRKGDRSTKDGNGNTLNVAHQRENNVSWSGNEHSNSDTRSYTGSGSFASTVSSGAHSHHTKYGLMQDWDNHARKRAVGWYELFTDLIFVTVIIKMSDMYKALWYQVIIGDDGDKDWVKQAEYLFQTFAVHLSFFTIWLEMAVIQTRFTSKKPFFGLMKYFYFAGSITMAMQITKDDPPSANSVGFCFGLIVCGVSHVLIHIHLCGIPRAALYVLINVCVMIIALSILFVGVFAPSDIARMVCITLSMGLVYWRTSNTFQVNAMQIPVNVHHFAERFGLLMMIYIGESIIAILLPEGDFTFEHYAIVHLGFLNIYILRFIYFNLAHASCKHEGDSHALRNAGKPGSIAFVNAHLLLSFFLLLEAVGEKFMLKAQQKNKLPLEDAYFFVIAHIATQLIMLFIRHTHQRVRIGVSPYVHLILRIVLTIVLFILIPRFCGTAIWLLLVTVIITLMLAFFDAAFVNWMKSQQVAKHEDSQFFDYGEEMKTIRQFDEYKKSNIIDDHQGYNEPQRDPVHMKNVKNMKKIESHTPRDTKQRESIKKQRDSIKKKSSITKKDSIHKKHIDNTDAGNNVHHNSQHTHSHQQNNTNNIEMKSPLPESETKQIEINDNNIETTSHNSGDNIVKNIRPKSTTDIVNDNNNTQNGIQKHRSNELIKQKSILDKLENKGGAIGNITREWKKRQSIHNLTRGLPTNVWVNAPQKKSATKK